MGDLVAIDAKTDTVRQLEDLLAKAKQGLIVGVGIVSITADSEMRYTYSVDNPQKPHLIAGLELLKLKLFGVPTP